MKCFAEIVALALDEAMVSASTKYGPARCVIETVVFDAMVCELA